MSVSVQKQFHTCLLTSSELAPGTLLAPFLICSVVGFCHVPDAARSLSLPFSSSCIEPVQRAALNSYSTMDASCGTFGGVILQ